MEAKQRVMPLMSWEREALARKIESAIDDVVIGSMFSRADAEEIQRLCQQDDGTVRVTLNRGRADEKTCTPAWYAIDNNKYELLPYVLGTKLQSIPPAFETGWQKLDLVQAMAAAEGGPARTSAAVEQVMKCFDLEHHKVADKVWKTAVGLLDRDDRHKKNMFETVLHAAQILALGGVPQEGVAEYQRVLALTVALEDKRCRTIAACFASKHIAPASVLGRMLDNGLLPNAQIGGMPLLHYAAVGNEALIQKLIDLRADVYATCPIETCLEAYHIEREKFMNDPCSAADLAEAAGRPEHANMIQAARAHNAVRKTLERFGIKKCDP